VPVEDDARRLRAIADAVPALIAYVDARQRYRFNNHGYAEWFGCTVEELRNKAVMEVLGAAAYEVVRPEIEKALSGQIVRYERLVPYETGARWTHTEFVPDIDETGNVLGFVALVTDITERKRAEEEVRRIQEQMLLSDRLASIGTLAMGIAHEINNPLAIVIANQSYVATALRKLLSDLRRDQADSGPEAEALSELKSRVAARIGALEEELCDAHEAADRVRLIVRNLEVFASPDSERRTSVDLHRVLASAVRALRDEISHDGRIVEHYGEIPRVEGSEALLGQVFLHLLVNAAHAIHQRQGINNEIRITTFTDAGRAVIRVADTGCGIASEHIGRIFDPFFTTKPVGKGTGLGLWVSSRVVAEVGGTIAVESEVGKGTAFTVTLPAAGRAIR
jgi:PAS domain S-box-containing protein